jgi:Domain of unknown function (DUF5076)
MAALVVKQLAVPPDAQERGGEEILRAFIVDQGLSVSIQRAFDEPSTWGILLVDIARHAARIFASDAGMTEAEALRQIRNMFDAEWSRPTDLGTTSAIN